MESKHESLLPGCWSQGIPKTLAASDCNSSHSSLLCKQFGLDVNHQETLRWDKCTGLCKGHTRLGASGSQNLGLPPHGCRSPGQDIQTHGFSRQGFSVVSAQAFLPKACSSVQDRLILHTFPYLCFPHAWLKNCLPWAGASLHGHGRLVLL